MSPIENYQSRGGGNDRGRRRKRAIQFSFFFFFFSILHHQKAAAAEAEDIIRKFPAGRFIYQSFYFGAPRDRDDDKLHCCSGFVGCCPLSACFHAFFFLLPFFLSSPDRIGTDKREGGGGGTPLVFLLDELHLDTFSHKRCSARLPVSSLLHFPKMTKGARPVDKFRLGKKGERGAVTFLSLL